MLKKSMLILFLLLLGKISLYIYYSSLDQCYGYDFEFTSTDDREPTISEIIKGAGNCLNEQRAIYTKPEINGALIKRVYDVKLPRFIESLSTYIYSFYVSYTMPKKLQAGIILYDYNFNKNFASDKQKIEHIRRSSLINIYMKNSKTGSKYRILINPFIVSDCVPFNVPISYCRGQDLVSIDNNYTNDEKSSSISDQYSHYINVYKKLGLSSSLGPAVDFYASQFEEQKDLNNFTSKISKTMEKSSFIPVIKHFTYDGSIGDSHLTFSINDLSWKDFESQLKPYRKVEELSFPYMIMTTHQAIGTLDKKMSATQSYPVYSFIRKNFPNAIVLADSISMKGMKGHNFYEKLITGKADLYIIHLGLHTPWLKLINSKKGFNEMRHSDKSIERILQLKKHYGLLKITKI